MLKKILLSIAALLLLAVIGVAAFAYSKIRAFDASMAKVYEVPLPAVASSTDPAVLARGKHLAESLGGCLACHGANLAGGRVEDFGPLGRVVSANLTSGKNGRGASYSDGELARVIKHGIKRDGRSVVFMPSHELKWWPEDDVAALVSYLRTFPPVDTEPTQHEVKAFGKVLDQLNMVPLDIARRIDHQNMPSAPTPAPTAEYGGYVAQLCTGCHGSTLSGGRIPGTPPEVPVPLNITPHETGLKDWAFGDFEKLMREGVRKNGQKLHPFMPVDTTKNYDDTELKAVWAYLQSVPARPFGGR